MYINKKHLFQLMDDLVSATKAVSYLLVALAYNALLSIHQCDLTGFYKLFGRASPVFHEYHYAYIQAYSGLSAAVHLIAYYC